MSTPSSSRWSKSTVSQLKEELSKRGLDLTGKKADLVSRLDQNDEEKLKEEAEKAETAAESEDAEEKQEVEQEEDDEGAEGAKDTTTDQLLSQIEKLTEEEEEEMDYEEMVEEEQESQEAEESKGDDKAVKEEKTTETKEKGEEKSAAEEDKSQTGLPEQAPASGDDDSKAAVTEETKEEDVEMKEDSSQPEVEAVNGDDKNKEAEDLEDQEKKAETATGADEADDEVPVVELHAMEDSEGEDDNQGGWKRQNSKPRDEDKPKEEVKDGESGDGKRVHYTFKVVEKGQLIVDCVDYRRNKKVVMHPLSMADLSRPEILECLDKCSNFIVRFRSNTSTGGCADAPRAWDGMLEMDFITLKDSIEAKDNLKKLSENAEVSRMTDSTNKNPIRDWVGKDDKQLVGSLDNILCAEDLTEDVDDTYLYTVFPEASMIAVPQRNKKPQGYAYIQFPNMEKSIKALKERKGRLTIGDKTVPLKPVRGRYETSSPDLLAALYPEEKTKPKGLLSVKVQTEIKNELRALGLQLAKMPNKKGKGAMKIKQNISTLMEKMKTHEKMKKQLFEEERSRRYKDRSGSSSKDSQPSSSSKKDSRDKHSPRQEDKTSATDSKDKEKEQSKKDADKETKGDSQDQEKKKKDSEQELKGREGGGSRKRDRSRERSKEEENKGRDGGRRSRDLDRERSRDRDRDRERSRDRDRDGNRGRERSRDNDRDRRDRGTDLRNRIRRRSPPGPLRREGEKSPEPRMRARGRAGRGIMGSPPRDMPQPAARPMMPGPQAGPQGLAQLISQVGSGGASIQDLMVFMQQNQMNTQQQQQQLLQLQRQGMPMSAHAGGANTWPMMGGMGGPNPQSLLSSAEIQQVRANRSNSGESRDKRDVYDRLGPRGRLARGNDRSPSPKGVRSGRRRSPSPAARDRRPGQPRQPMRQRSPPPRSRSPVRREERKGPELTEPESKTVNLLVKLSDMLNSHMSQQQQSAPQPVAPPDPVQAAAAAKGLSAFQQRGSSPSLRQGPSPPHRRLSPPRHGPSLQQSAAFSTSQQQASSLAAGLLPNPSTSEASRGLGRMVGSGFREEDSYSMLDKRPRLVTYPDQGSGRRFAESDNLRSSFSDSYGEKYEPEEPTEDTYGSDLGRTQSSFGSSLRDYDARQSGIMLRDSASLQTAMGQGGYALGAAAAPAARGTLAPAGRPGILGPTPNNPRTVPRPFAPSRQMPGSFGGGY